MSQGIQGIGVCRIRKVDHCANFGSTGSVAEARQTRYESQEGPCSSGIRSRDGDLL